MTALSLTLLVPSSQHHCITILAYARHLSVDHLLFPDYFSIFTVTTVLVRFSVLLQSVALSKGVPYTISPEQYGVKAWTWKL